MNQRDESGESALEVRGISKAYGHVQALRGVNLAVNHGEVVALVGDNGAGKSTLVKIIAGAHAPDEGSIWVRGEEVELYSPLAARSLGIETVYQDLALTPDLSVWANMFLGREMYRRGPGRLVGWLDKPGMRRRTREELAQLRIAVPNVNASVSDLSGGQRQSVAVARSVAWARNIVMMDEPTASLGIEAQEKVGGLVRRLAESGLGVIFVTHNLAQVFDLSDRIVVLRHGRRVASRDVERTSREEIVGLITGAIPGEDE